MSEVTLERVREALDHARSLSYDNGDSLEMYETGCIGYPLTDIALDIAEQVAGMRYEYAVQVPISGSATESWRYVVRPDRAGTMLLTPMPGLGAWDKSVEDAKQRAALYGITLYRIMRRLVADAEVVE